MPLEMRDGRYLVLSDGRQGLLEQWPHLPVTGLSSRRSTDLICALRGRSQRLLTFHSHLQFYKHDNGTAKWAQPALVNRTKAAVGVVSSDKRKGRVSPAFLVDCV